MCISKRTTWLLSVLYILLLLPRPSRASAVRKAQEEVAGRCQAPSAQTTYSCLKCDTVVQVTDCLDDCPGYSSSAFGFCFDRHLFRKLHNPNNDDDDDDDIDNPYYYLWRDIVGAVVWFVIAGVATASGVGGGGIYVPVGILLFGLAPKQSSGLSQASIFGASLGGLILNLRNVHPHTTIRNEAGKRIEEDGSVLDKETTLEQEDDETFLKNGGSFYTRPLIHYDMALFLAPMEMAGAVLGVLIQKILPNWLYLLLASIVLGLTGYKTMGKYMNTRSKEKQAEEKVGKVESHRQEEEDEDNKEVLVDDEIVADANEVPSEKEKPIDEHTELRHKFLQEDMRQYPLEKVAALFFLWIGLLVLTLLKGGKGVESLVGITCQSPWYGVLIGCQFLWMFSFALFFGWRLLENQKARVAVAYPFLPDDIVWNLKWLRFYGSLTFAAGVVAGLIGIGGGMVLGPMMLIMGIHPRVSSATTATMVVLTSSSVAVIFVTSGIVPWSYAVFYFALCLIGAVLGKSKIDGYVKRTGRASLLILILACIIIFATIGCLVVLFLNVANNNWCFDGFHKFCSVSSDDENECSVDRLLLQLVSP